MPRMIDDTEANILAAGATMVVVVVLAALWKPILTWTLIALVCLHQAAGALTAAL